MTHADQWDLRGSRLGRFQELRRRETGLPAFGQGCVVMAGHHHVTMKDEVNRLSVTERTRVFDFINEPTHSPYV